jgi:hypothetical protein
MGRLSLKKRLARMKQRLNGKYSTTETDEVPDMLLVDIHDAPTEDEGQSNSDEEDLEDRERLGLDLTQDPVAQLRWEEGADKHLRRSLYTGKR